MAFDWRLAAGGAALVWATLLAPATSHAQPDACRQIRQACRADGFEPGKGLVEQCYNPIVQGGGGRAAGLPKVSADVVAACRAGLTTNARPAPAPLPPQGRGGSGDGGQTVYDPKLKVYWLADADLPAKQTFGVAGVNRDGSMSYPTAVAWVRAMNATDHGRGYLGHNNWMLPTNPSNDPGCSSSNRKGGGSFGYGCKKSALGSLYYKTLGLREPATAVAMPDTRTGPFHDFQPYLYWTQTLNGHGVSNGYDTFSFDTGWSGSNVSNHVLYALPMIPGNPFGAPAHRGLQPVAGGQAVYDPASDATWLADADFAKTKSFGVAGINPDGSMQEGAAATWAAAMAKARWLGKPGWTLPTGAKCGGFNCKKAPLGALFYDGLGLAAGDAAVATPDKGAGPFHDLQPYLYWACAGETIGGPCAGAPAAGMAWSFSFGNGFEGTDLDANDLFVTAYYPAQPTPPPPGPPPHPVRPPPCGAHRCQ